MARFLTLISGVLAVVLPNVVGSLPVSVQATVTAVGGAVLAILAMLEHPTTKSAAATASQVAAKVTAPPAK